MFDQFKGFSIKAVIVGCLVGVISSIVIVVILGFFADLLFGESVATQSFVRNSTIVIIILSASVGGYLAARLAKTKKLTHSWFAGILFAYIKYLFDALQQKDTSYVLFQFVVLIAFSILGGYLESKLGRKDDGQNI